MAGSTGVRGNIAHGGNAVMTRGALGVLRPCMQIFCIVARQTYVTMRTFSHCRCRCRRRTLGFAVAGGTGLSVKDNQIALAGSPRWMAYDTIARCNIARTRSTVVTIGTDVMARRSMQIIRRMTGIAEAVVIA